MTPYKQEWVLFETCTTNYSSTLVPLRDSNASEHKAHERISIKNILFTQLPALSHKKSNMYNSITGEPNEQKKNKSRLAAKPPLDSTKNVPSIVESTPEFRYVKLCHGHLLLTCSTVVCPRLRRHNDCTYGSSRLYSHSYCKRIISAPLGRLLCNPFRQSRRWDLLT